jgi:hypothetical protein
MLSVLIPKEFRIPRIPRLDSEGLFIDEGNKYFRGLKG